MPSFLINVHDFDRDECPENPWAATVTDGTGRLVGAGVAGLGRTPSEAVANALLENYIDADTEGL